jgi:hypothetical protein
LPLVPIQEAAKKILARSAQLVMKWIRNDEEPLELYNKRTKVNIDPLQIPDRVVFDVILDVDLPQDMLRNANIASMLKQARLVDDRWIHENILRIGQTVNMKKRIIAQDVADALAGHTVQTYIQQATQPPQPPPDQQQPGQPGPEAGQMPMNEQPQGMPGEMGMPPGMGGMPPGMGGGMMG